MWTKLEIGLYTPSIPETLLTTLLRVIQERETREKLKKEKAEVRLHTVGVCKKMADVVTARSQGEERGMQ